MTDPSQFQRFADAYIIEADMQGWFQSQSSEANQELMMAPIAPGYGNGGIPDFYTRQWPGITTRLIGLDLSADEALIRYRMKTVIFGVDCTRSYPIAEVGFKVTEDSPSPLLRLVQFHREGLIAELTQRIAKERKRLSLSD